MAKVFILFLMVCVAFWSGYQWGNVKRQQAMTKKPIGAIKVDRRA